MGIGIEGKKKLKPAQPVYIYIYNIMLLLLANKVFTVLLTAYFIMREKRFGGKKK